MDIDRVRTAPPFEDLFPIDAATLNAIQADMKARGYDQSQPIVLWKGKGIVVDGHTRGLAASSAGIKDIPVHHMEFADEDEALAYTIHNQRDRRNMTDADLVRCIQAVDKRNTHGGDRRSSDAPIKGPSEPLKRTADETAAIVGTSSTKVKKARAVTDHGAPDVKEAVRKGDMTINKAYTETQRNRREQSQKKAGAGKPAGKKEVPKLGPPCNGMQFAHMAIMDLEQIRDDDAERDQAFTHVRGWLDGKQTDSAAHGQV